MSTDASRKDEIAIDGCRVRVRLDGPEARPALVLAHMLGTDLTLWDALVPELTSHFRVVRLDARGHGGSDVGPGAFGIDRLGRDVLAVLDHFDIARAHFCGLSMGGAIGLWLLAHAGHRIERALIAGAAAKLGTPESWNARIAAARVEGMEQAVPSTLERWFRREFREREPEKVEAVAGLIRSTSVEGYAACCAALRDMDLREAVRGVSNPVLVLRGVDDPSATKEGALELLGAMENAAAQELAASHCACVEDEAGFRSAVLRFLTAKDASKVAPRRTATKRVPQKRESAKAASGVAAAARRLGGRGRTAARRPVASTPPASKKAAVKAEATRKIAARKPARTAAARAEPVRARAAGPARTGGRTTSARAAVPKAGAVARSGAVKASASKVGAAKAGAAKAGVAKAGRAATPSKDLASRKTAARPGTGIRGAGAKVAASKTTQVRTVRTKAAVGKPAATASRSVKPAVKPGKIKLSAAQMRARSSKGPGAETPKTKTPSAKTPKTKTPKPEAPKTKTPRRGKP